MAARYWIGNGGNWNDTAHWSTTSGGSGGASVPSSADDVFFDAASFSVGSTVTLNATANCLSLNWTGLDQAVTFTSSAYVLNIYGSFTGSSNLTISFTSATYPIVFCATSAQTLTMSSTVWAVAVTNFNGVGGKWTLQTDWTVGGTGVRRIYILYGELDTNGYTLNLTGDGFLHGNHASNSVITLGSSTLNIGYWYYAQGIVNAGTSTINANGNFEGSGKTFYDVIITTWDVGLSANTFHNLSIIGTNTRSCWFSLSGTLTINNNLTLSGYNSGDSRLSIKSSVNGVSRSIICDGTITASNVDFMDISGEGSASWNLAAIMGLCGDGGNNSGITTTTPVTLYFIHSGTSTTQFCNTSKWSTSSGGSTGARVPLMQDTAVFDANSFTAACILELNRFFIPSIDMSAVNRAVSVFWYWGPIYFLGDLKTSSTVVRETWAANTYFWGRRGQHVVNIQGTFSFPNTTYFQATASGSYTLETPITVATLTTNRVFYPNGQTITATISGCTFNIKIVVNGVASVTGTIGTVSTGGAIASSSAGSSSISAILHGHGILQSASNGVSADTAMLKGYGKLFSESTGTAISSGVIKGRGTISAQSNGVASISFVIHGHGKLISVSNGIATISADLSQALAIGSIVAGSAGSSYISGILHGSGILQSASNGISANAALLKGRGRMVSIIVGITTMFGAIYNSSKTSGIARGYSSNIAKLRGIGKIVSRSMGTSDASATIKVKRVLAVYSMKYTISHANPRAFTTEHANPRAFTTEHANPRAFTTEHANPRAFTTEHSNSKRFNVCRIYSGMPLLNFIPSMPENPEPR